MTTGIGAQDLANMDVFKLSLWLSLLCLYAVGTNTNTPLVPMLPASCMEHRERGCSKDDDCCGELICKDIALTYFLGKQHYCMKRHDPLGDTTPVRRETQSNLRATGLDLHAENVDFVAQYPRKLGDIDYRKMGGIALVKIGLVAFGLLDDKFGITDSFFDFLGIGKADPVEKVLQGILDTIEDIRDKMNEVSTKIDGLIRAVACVNFRQAQVVTDDRVGTIESAFEDMKTYLRDNVTLSADEALALFERVQNTMENFGNTLVRESGTIPQVIQCLSAYENDASNLVDYWASVEYYRQTYKNIMLSGLLVMIYAQEIHQNLYKKITLDNIAKSVAEDIETMYEFTGVAFPSGQFLHVRNSNRALANFGYSDCSGDNENRCGGLESIVKGNCSCNVVYKEEEYCEPVAGATTFFWPGEFILFPSPVCNFPVIHPKDRCGKICRKYSGIGAVFDELAKAAHAYTSYIGVSEGEAHKTFEQWWKEHGGSGRQSGYHVEYWGMENSCTLTSKQFNLQRDCIFGNEKLWAGARPITYVVSIKGDEVTKKDDVIREPDALNSLHHNQYRVSWCKDLPQQDLTPNWMLVLANKAAVPGTLLRNQQQKYFRVLGKKKEEPYWMVLDFDTEVNSLDMAGRLTNWNRSAVQTAAFGCIPKGTKCQKDGAFCCQVSEGFNTDECRKNDEGNFTCQEIHVCTAAFTRCEMDGPPCCGSHVCQVFGSSFPYCYPPRELH